MREWMDLTSAEIKGVLEAEGINPAGTYKSKAALAGYALTVLGPDPDCPLVIPGVNGDALAVVEDDGRTVHQRLADVLADLPAIPKGEQAPGNMGGYSYRGIEQITAALKPLLAKHGIVMLPRVVSRQDGERPTKQGGVMHVVDLEVEFTFYGLEGDAVVASMWGQGTDAGDKSPQKATTSAFKSMLAIVFCIADAETDSERHDVPETRQDRRASKADLAAIAKWLEAIPDEYRDAERLGVADQFGPSSALMESQVDEVIGWLEARLTVITAETPPVAATTKPCEGCGGTGLTYDGAVEVVCPACGGAMIVCVECGKPGDAHTDDCSMRPL